MESDSDSDVPLAIPIGAEPPAPAHPRAAEAARVDLSRLSVDADGAASTGTAAAAAPAAQGAGVQRDGPVPVTVITGYLGAGKTTLVNYILTADHGLKIAVIMNEYGQEQGIESAIVEAQAPSGRTTTGAEEWVEVANGCLCCSVKNDFVMALEALLDKPGASFDYIVIETTGLANPGPVATALWTDPELEARIALDGVITVADARNLVRQLSGHGAQGGEVNEAQQQVAYADVVLLNKCDLVSGDAEVQELTAAIRAINAGVEVIPTVRSKVDLRHVLRLKSYDEATYEPRGPPAHGHGTAACPEHGAACGGCAHNPQVTTVSLATDAPLDKARFQDWLDAKLWERDGSKDDIYRMKGVLFVDGQARKGVFQAVHELYDIVEGGEWGDGEVPRTRVVVIGRNLDRARLQAGLDACARAGS
ncbi:unnamed protein product [Pedinophyceae sp. YPF-701]|nr:unnamed protein product [Pedinophyceae sp. YPF-701]